MKSMAVIRFLLLLGLCAPSCGVLSSERPNIVFWPSVVTSEISQRTVTNSFQDSSGAIWLSTQEGLNRYDGKRVEKHLPLLVEKNGLPIGQLLGVQETNDGELWVATASSLAKFDRTTKEFLSPQALEGKKLNISSFAAGDKGDIWLGLKGAIGVYRPETDQYFQHPLSSSQFDMQDEVVDLVFSELGNFVLVKNRGVFRANWIADQLDLQPLVAQSKLADIQAVSMAIKNAEIWIGSQNQGLFIVDTEIGLIRNISEGNDSLDLPSNSISSILHFEDMTWLGTGRGLSITTDGGRSFQNYSDFNEGIPDAQVYSIFKSSDDTFWLGFFELLVQARLNVATPINRNNSNILSDTINGVYLSRDGVLWLATGAGVSFQQPGSAEFEHINSFSHGVFRTDDTTAIVVDEKAAWIGTFDGGLYRYDRAGNTVVKIPSTTDKSPGLESDAITALTLTGDGTVVVGTYGGGLSLVDPTGQVIRTFKSPLGHDLTNRVYALLLDHDESILIGTENGISRLSSDLQTYTDTAFSKLALPNISTPRILSTIEITHGKNNELWVGTQRYGVIQAFRDESLHMTSVVNRSTELNLPSNAIHGIHSDLSGKYWISHNEGLTRFEPETFQHRHYTKYKYYNN